MQDSEVFLQPQRAASAAAAQTLLFRLIPIRKRAAVGLEAMVRQAGVALLTKQNQLLAECESGQ